MSHQERKQPLLQARVLWDTDFYEFSEGQHWSSKAELLEMQDTTHHLPPDPPVYIHKLIALVFCIEKTCVTRL